MSSSLRISQILRPLVLMLSSALAFGAVSSCSKESKPAGGGAQPALKATPAASAVVKCEAGPDGKCVPSALCSPDCTALVTSDCAKCEAASDCSAFATACENPMLSANDRQVCYDIMTCIQTSHCLEAPKATPGSCYCGELDLKACMAAPFTGPGAPKGACHDLILKGMPKAQNHVQVLANLTTRDRAAGFAISRLNCQKFGYRRLCSDVCGFPQR